MYFHLLIRSTFVLLLFGKPISSHAEEMAFRSVSNGGNCNQCGWTFAQGEITTETATIFETLVTNGEINPKYIRIHSSGGDLNGGFELGRLFRKYESTVEVGKTIPLDETWYQEEQGECLSACAYAFLGGHFRDVPEKGKLGFHQFYDKDVLTNMTEAAFTGFERLRDQAAVGVIINYLIEMDISTELYPLVAVTPPGEMRYLDKAEANRLRVTNIEDPVSAWRLMPFGKGLVAELGNAVSGRKVRLYCAGKKRHLTYFYKNDTPGKEASWRPEEVLDNYPDIFVTNGNNQWPIKFDQFAYDTPKENLIFVFEVSQDAASSLADSSEFRIDSPSAIPRAYQNFFLGLEVDPVTGDKRIPKLALRNCV